MPPAPRFVVAAAISLVCAARVVCAADAADRSPAEKHNLELVLDFWNNVFMERDTTRFAEFFASDYVDHNPNITTPGLPGLLEYVQKLAARQSAKPAGGGGPLHSDVVVATVDGDVVTLIRKRTLPDPSDPTKMYEAYGFEAMRVQDGKIVEHWDSVMRQGAAAAGTPATKPVNSR